MVRPTASLLCLAVVSLHVSALLQPLTLGRNASHIRVRCGHTQQALERASMSSLGGPSLHAAQPAACPLGLPQQGNSQALVGRMLAGEPVRIVVLGGSITAGIMHTKEGTRIRPSEKDAWPRHLQGYLRAAFGNNKIVVENHAKAGGGSIYAARGLRSLVWPAASVDMVLVETRVNDELGNFACLADMQKMGLADHGPLRASLLQRGSKPLSHTSAEWNNCLEHDGKVSVDELVDALGRLEELLLAIRTLPHAPVVAQVELGDNDEGSSACSSRASLANLYGAASWNFQPYTASVSSLTDAGEDCRWSEPHFCRPGHRAVARLIAGAFTSHISSKCTSPSDELVLPITAMRSGWPSAPKAVAVSDAVRKSVVPTQMSNLMDRAVATSAVVQRTVGFEYATDAADKWGMIAHTAGDVVTLRVQTGPAGRIVLGVLRSYKGVGVLHVAVQGSVDAPRGVDFDCLWTKKASVYDEVEVQGGRPNSAELVSVTVKKSGRESDKIKVVYIAGF